MGNFMVAAGPAENGFAANMNVNVNADNATPEQALPVVKTVLAKIMTDYQSAGEGFLTIDGKKSMFFSSKFRMGQLDLQNLQYAIFDAGKVYTITFTTSRDTFSKCRPIFEKAALSAQVN